MSTQSPVAMLAIIFSMVVIHCESRSTTVLVISLILFCWFWVVALGWCVITIFHHEGEYHLIRSSRESWQPYGQP